LTVKVAKGRKKIYISGIAWIWTERIVFMKVSNSIKTLKSRHKACVVVRRRGRLYVINKINPRFKARQG